MIENLNSLFFELFIDIDKLLIITGLIIINNLNILYNILTTNY